MKVIKAGYTYGLHNVENPQLKGQIIQFIERGPIVKDSEMLKTIENGTTLEEVLAVALDKAKTDFKSREGSLVITKIQEALLWLGEIEK